MSTPASFVVLSDMHLGYDRSILNNQEAINKLAAEIGKACGGNEDQKGFTEKLVLNGDCFEICIPLDTGFKYGTISPFTSTVSSAFFAALAETTRVNEIVIVPGNHDWSLWRQLLVNNSRVPNFPCTGYSPYRLKHLGISPVNIEQVIWPLFGNSYDKYHTISVAYPTFFLGLQWPYCAFHHGHFLDSLVLGHDAPEKYYALSAAGVSSQPNVILDDTETLRSVSLKTDSFVNSLWKANSVSRELMWALIRRDEAALHCLSVPASGSRPVTGEKVADMLGANLQWFTDMLIMDTYAPFPATKNKDYPSYLFIGHDHYGGIKDIAGPDGFNWRVINTGGWTDDGNKGITPHCHIAVWPKGANAPELIAVRV